jgi:hypothetical protein
MGGRRAALALALTAACWLWPAPAAAETIDQAYARALKDYYAGRYEQAVDELERILSVAVNDPDVHYNLGCAYYRLGRLGPAIYHFEKTLAHSPSAEDARFNLETARAQAATLVKDELRGATGEVWWMRLVGSLGPGTWAVMLLVLWWLTFGLLLLLRYVRPGPARAGLMVANAFVALLTLVCVVLALGRGYMDRGVSQGIVLPARVEVREGPGDGTKASFRLHAGFKVRLQARSDGWVRVRLPNGLEGWLPERQVGVL